MKTSRGCLLLVAMLTAPASASSAPHGPSPMATLKKSNDEVRRLLKKQVSPGSAEESALRAEIKRIVNGFIDYGELAKRALGNHWTQITSGQRDEFVGVLRDLIESNYVKQIRSNVDYEVKYLGENLKGEEATVRSMVKAKRRGREQEIPIDYKFSWNRGKWQVFDVITDEVSLVKNYRNQFAKIIDKEGFDGLMAKMKKRLGEQKETSSG